MKRINKEWGYPKEGELCRFRNLWKAWMLGLFSGMPMAVIGFMVITPIIRMRVKVYRNFKRPITVVREEPTGFWWTSIMIALPMIAALDIKLPVFYWKPKLYKSWLASKTNRVGVFSND